MSSCRPHPHIAARRKQGAPKRGVGVEGFNGRLALKITAVVGTMWCAYAFSFLALLALPSALGLSWLPDRTLIIVAWIAQTFLQLVLLSVIMVGQSITGKAADARSEMAFKDTEAILHEVRHIHDHLDGHQLKV